MNTSKIALIEIGLSHDECLLSQMHAIKSTGRKVLLITLSGIVERNPEFENYIDDTFFIDMSGSKAERGKEVSKIWKKLKSSNCEKVILNTAEGNLIRLLCLKAIFSKMEFIGIVHNSKKFEKSFTQTIINKKVKKYLLLSENLLQTISPPSGIKVDYFYPLRFRTQKNLIEKRTNAIVIIGGVEKRRKDLDGFLKIAQQVKDQNVRFIFLGKSNQELEEVQEFLKAIDTLGLKDHIITYDHFVPQQEFDTVVQNASLILPIVHPDTKSSEEYFKSRISGAMSVSFGYKIPMMIHEGYQYIDELKAASFYYNMDNFGVEVAKAIGNLSEKVDSMKSHEKYDVDFQEKRYLEFLLDK